jgi:phage portal protein BeeE
VSLLDRVAAARGQKSWAGEPDFWTQDVSRLAMLGPQLPERERIENDFEGYVGSALKANVVVAACLARRSQVFSQGRFAYRRWVNGSPGDPFTTGALDLLQSPWPNGTTGELLARMEQDASLAGNFYATTVDYEGPRKDGVRQARIGKAATGASRRIVRLRPDWVTLVIDAPSGNPYDLDARVVAYEYQVPSGYGGRAEPTLLLPSEVAHYSPLPDPVARFRGMSWLTPALREILADKAGTDLKRAYYSQGMTPGMVVKGIRAANPEKFAEAVDMMEARHAGARNAFRTLYLADGADAMALGADLKQLDLKTIQGSGETRIAVAAGVPAAILGISEGLAGSTLNAGNFTAAKRLFAETTMQDLWDIAAASLTNLATPPAGAELMVDGRWIPFLREDAKDRSAIQDQEAQTIRTLVDAGFEPKSIIAALGNNDWSQLKHSGLYSVQLREPGSDDPAAAGAMPTLGEANGTPINGANGSVNGRQAVLSS